MALRTLVAPAAAVPGLNPRTTPPLMAMNRISHRDLSSGFRRFGTPAHGPAARCRNLEQNNINININGNDAAADNLMLVAERYPKNGPHKLSIPSIENKSLEPIQPDNRPNFSRLNSSACYEFLACCDKWAVLGSEDEGISTPADLLCDPRTDEVWPIPQFQVKPRLPVKHSWDPLWGVGFDPCSGDCKVVKCSGIYYSGRALSELIAGLLSVGTGSWREIRFPHDMNIYIYEEYSVHINGFYYWTTILNDIDRNVIVPFDFGREEFPPDLIPMPDPDIGWYREPYIVLAEYHGSLAVILHEYVSRQFEIWVWSNGDRSWSHLSTLHIPRDAEVRKVVGLYNNDKVILIDSKY